MIAVLDLNSGADTGMVDIEGAKLLEGDRVVSYNLDANKPTECTIRRLKIDRGEPFWGIVTDTGGMCGLSCASDPKYGVRKLQVATVSNIAGDSYTPPPNTFYLAYRGSVAHGMYVPPENPDSIDDIDLMGFVFGDLEDYFGLREWGSRGTKEIWQGRYDVVLYEIRKAVSLLLQGNPNIMSMLWVSPQHQIVVEEPARALIAHRTLFAGKHVYNAFAGYAHAQLEKMESREPGELREYMAVTAELKHRGAHPNHKGEKFPEPDRSTGEARDAANWGTERLLAKLAHYQKKGENLGYMGEKRKQLVLKHGYDSKNAAHLIRLLRMCIEFLRTGEMLVYRPDAAELLDIKTGKWPLDQVKQLAQDLFEQARAARDASTLPDEPNRQAVEKLLVQLLVNHFYVSACIS